MKKSKGISRRDFVKLAGISAVAGLMSSCNLLSSSSPDGTISARRLQEEFDLTPVTAQTFSVFIANRDQKIGRRAIARELGISPNTLKDQITRIVRHVRSKGNPGVTRINDAVNVAVNLLG